MDNMSDIFANRLNSAIKRSGLPAKQICIACNIAPSSLSNYRHGSCKCSIDNLAALAKCLHVSPNYLLGFSDEPNLNPPFIQRIGLSESSYKTLTSIATDDNTPEDSISAISAISNIIDDATFPHFVNTCADYLTHVRKSFVMKAEHNVESYFLDDDRVPSDMLDNILGNNITSDCKLTDSVTQQKEALKNAVLQFRQIILACGRKIGKEAYDEMYEALHDTIDADIYRAESLLGADWDDLE